jgi:isopenicillin N synthase-like dioxygenase
MSTTTVTETASSQLPLNLTLGNGQKIYFHSDESIEADEIPVIDISGIFSDELANRKAVAGQIREAAHRIGFFYIVGHGVEQHFVDQTFAEAKRFFDLSEERKLEVTTDLVSTETAVSVYRSSDTRQNQGLTEFRFLPNSLDISRCRQ